MKSKLINCFLLIILLIWNYKYCLGNTQKYEVAIELWKYINYHAKYDCPHERLDCKIYLDMKVGKSYKDLKNYIVYKTNWFFPNVFGFTKNGIHDSRKEHNLTVTHTFNAELEKPLLYVEMFVSLVDKYEKLKYKNSFEVHLTGNGTYTLKSLAKSKVNTTIQIKSTFTCQQHYFGVLCTKHCRPIPNYFSCLSNGERQCGANKFGKYCNEFKHHENICANITSCNCLSNNGSFVCTQNYLECSEYPNLCLNSNSYCTYNLASLSHYCQETLRVDNKNSYMAYVKYSMIGIGILLFVILITVIYRSRRNKWNRGIYTPTWTNDDGPSGYDVIKVGLNNNNQNRKLPAPLPVNNDSYVMPQSNYENINKSKNSESINYVNHEVIDVKNDGPTNPPLPPRYFKVND